MEGKLWSVMDDVDAVMSARDKHTDIMALVEADTILLQA